MIRGKLTNSSSAITIIIVIADDEFVSFPLIIIPGHRVGSEVTAYQQRLALLLTQVCEDFCIVRINFIIGSNLNQAAIIPELD